MTENKYFLTSLVAAFVSLALFICNDEYGFMSMNIALGICVLCFTAMFAAYAIADVADKEHKTKPQIRKEAIANFAILLLIIVPLVIALQSVAVFIFFLIGVMFIPGFLKACGGI